MTADLNIHFWYAVERAVRFLEVQASAIDKANPDDPYASLMCWDDIETLKKGIADGKPTGGPT